MKNKKLLMALVFGITIISLSIVGSFFCNWAICLLPFAFVPMTTLGFKYLKNLKKYKVNKKM